MLMLVRVRRCRLKAWRQAKAGAMQRRPVRGRKAVGRCWPSGAWEVGRWPVWEATARVRRAWRPAARQQVPRATAWRRPLQRKPHARCGCPQHAVTMAKIIQVCAFNARSLLIREPLLLMGTRQRSQEERNAPVLQEAPPEAAAAPRAAWSRPRPACSGD